MPLYEYECTACHHADSEFQKMSDDRLTVCPACGEGAYERQVALPSGALEREYAKPIEMHSIAPVTRGEIQSFKRRNPGVDTTPDGVPIARTRKQKLQILKNEGFQERN